MIEWHVEIDSQKIRWPVAASPPAPGQHFATEPPHNMEAAPQVQYPYQMPDCFETLLVSDWV